MKIRVNPFAAAACVLGLAACGGGGGGDANTGGGLNGVSTNGLPFAGATVGTGGDVATRAAGSTVTTQGALLTTGSGGPFLQTPVTVTGVSANTIRVQFADQDFTLNRNTSTDPTRFGGESIAGRMINEGDDVASAFFTRLDGGSDTRGVYFVAGNETNPASLSGSATYFFDIEGAGVQSATGLNEQTLVRGVGFVGDGQISANFATAGINGNATITAFGSDPDDTAAPEEATFTIRGSRTGNEYATNLEIQNCLAGGDCTSSSTMRGNFFGPSGNETAGIGIIDEAFTTQNGSGETQGIFTFLGARGKN